jgi:bacterioferritin (cytochrome b1)
MLETEPVVSLLRTEMESWRAFLEALRADDRAVARRMMERCYRFSPAIESSGKTYAVEPLLMTILLTQEERIGWLESELGRLKEEIGIWKKKAGY